MLVFKIVLFCSSLYKSHFLTDIFFNSKISCLYFFFLKRKNSMYIQEIFQPYQISVRFTKPLHIQQYKYRISVLHEMTGQQVIPCKSCFHVSERACERACMCAAALWTYCGYICGRQLCWLCQSRVCLSVLFSDGWCGWSELEITNSSFLSTSSSVPPFLRAPWMALRSSSFSCRLSRMKPGMQIIKEIVRRLRVRPRYAILRGTKKIDLMKISKIWQDIRQELVINAAIDSLC